MVYSMEEFKIEIPKELIAQYPSDKRDESRLLVLDTVNNVIIDDIFKNIKKYLKKGDCLVYNDARVIHARLYGKKESTGGKVEILLNRMLDKNRWLALVSPYRRVKVGTKIIIDGINESLSAKVTEKPGKGVCEIFFSKEVDYKYLDKIGEIPLPKYIKRKPDRSIDEERYQTVFSKKYGAVAAPTAGLHFTEAVIDGLKKMGVEFIPVTLYVDWGTFMPVREKDYRRHIIHNEAFEISEESAERINRCISEGRRLICIGTTTVRTLESSVGDDGYIKPVKGETSLYIYPGYRFKVVDGLITNFHMPDSTLILLVSAFAGKENILNAYRHAINKRYRFFSYGDAMFIIKKL